MFETNLKNDKIRKAVFPVAGFGTRFLPATKAMSKKLLPIVTSERLRIVLMRSN